MNRLLVFLTVVLAIGSFPPVYAKGGIESPEQQCYGISMVGYDSVINSRLGVTPEEVVHLAKKQRTGVLDNNYAPFLLKVIMDAYFWDNSPHEYAVKVMYFCAQNDYRNGSVDSIAKVNELTE